MKYPNVCIQLLLRDTNWFATLCLHTFDKFKLMGGRTAPTADPATDGPMFAVRWLKSQQMRSQRSSIKKISTLCVDNQLLARWVSLIAVLKQTMEFLCKANGTTLHYVLVLLSFSTLSDLRKDSIIAGKAM